MINFRFPDTKLFRNAAIEYLSSTENLEEETAENIKAVTNGKGITDAKKSEEIAATKNQGITDANHEEEGIADAKTNNKKDVVCPVTGEILDRENGYPWDARIHSAKRTRVARTKEWKLLRNIENRSPGLVEEVRNEFDARRNETVNEQPSLFDAVPEAPPTNGAAPPPPKLFDMPDQPTYTDILNYITARLTIEPDYQASVDRVLSKHTMTDLTQLTHMNKGFLASFGKWLDHEWGHFE